MVEAALRVAVAKDDARGDRFALHLPTVSGAAAVDPADRSLLYELLDADRRLPVP